MWKLETQKKHDYWTLNIEDPISEGLSSLTNMFDELENYDYSWSLICIEVWLETGEIIYYPCKEIGVEREEPVSFKIIFSELVRKYGDIECLIDQSEDLFESEYDRLTNEILGKLTKPMLFALNQKFDGADMVIVDPDMDVLFDSRTL